MQSTRVYLHIGLGKAGSTAIQAFLFANSAVLAANNFCYPRYRVGNAHQILAHKWGGWLSPAGIKRIRPNVVWKKLREQMDSNKKTFIISSERFTGATFDAPGVPEFVARTFEGLGTKIIVYLRPQGDLAESEYKQRVFSGLKISFDRFVDKLPPYFDYQALLARWAEVFGRENIIVRRYRTTNLVPDFLDAVGIPNTLPFVAREQRVQTSISALSAQLILALKLDYNNPDDTWQIEKIRSLLDSDTGRFLTDQAQDKIRNRYKESNKKVALTYLGEPKLFPNSQAERNGVIELSQPKLIGQRAMREMPLQKGAKLSTL